MTHRTRYFLVGSGLIVVVGLCTGLVAYYTGNLPLGAARGPAELAYVPSDTAAIAYADVRHIMDSEFRQRVRSLLPAGEGKQQLLAQTGIDVEQDVDSVVAALGGPDGRQQTPVVFIRGRFQSDRIEALAREHGATSEDYRGKRLLVEPAASVEAGTLVGGGRQPGQGGLALLEPGLLGFGSVERLKAAIDASAANQSAASSGEIMKLVGGVSASDAWVVGRFETLASDGRMATPMREQLSALQWFSLSADVDQAIICRVHAVAKDDQSGEQIRAVVNGMLGAARMLTNQDPRVSAALNSVQASGAGSDIDLSFSVPADIIDLVATAAHGSIGGARRQ
jgi:hypothetical protein